jgi:hypothetical protein
MVDADEDLFIANFTKPVQDRPTLFLKSFKEWALKALVRVTLRLYSNQSEQNEERYKVHLHIMKK